MTSVNFDRYRADLTRLVSATQNLLISMQWATHPEEVDRQLRTVLGDKTDAFIKKLPVFDVSYQSWYSEALAVVKQLLPDRFSDFKSHYDRPRSGRKDIMFSNYVIEDYFQGTTITRAGQVLVDRSAAIPRFQAQIAILKACEVRFDSSLLDIRQLVQADMMDDELSAARELSKNKFYRAAGVVAGVVLEKHLQTVALSHDVKVKVRPSLGDYIAALKDADIIATPEWRRLQHLSELRAKCTHNKGAEPTGEDLDDLIGGAERTIKTLF